MGDRGRGGGGRGRGRGKNLEQLGVQKGEALPERVSGPPETFPPLEFRPVQPPQEKNIAESYLLVIKKEFREHMQNSQYHIQPDVTRPDIERYSDRYNMLPNRRGQLNLHWSRFPKELRPGAIKSSKKRKTTNKKAFSVNVKRARLSQKEVDVTQTLDELEKKESAKDAVDEVEEDEDEEGKVDEENMEGDEEDEELDDGTDYVNNYFDNGEDFVDEEDDALEEGGTF